MLPSACLSIQISLNQDGTPFIDDNAIFFDGKYIFETNVISIILTDLDDQKCVMM